MSDLVYNITYSKMIHSGEYPFSKAKGFRVFPGIIYSAAFLGEKSFQKKQDWPERVHLKTELPSPFAIVSCFFSSKIIVVLEFAYY